MSSSTTKLAATAGGELWARPTIGKEYIQTGQSIMESPIRDLVLQSGVIDAVRSGQQVNLWDNACGAGTVTSLFQAAVQDVDPANLSVTCTDFSAGMIKATEERAKDENWKNVDVHIADSQDTKLPDAKFTHTITSFAFGLFPNSDAALNEIHRSLVPGGVFGMSTWNYIGWPELLQRGLAFAGSPLVVGDWLGEGNKRSGYGWNSAEAIEKLLTDRGYTDIKITLKPTKKPMTKEEFTDGPGGKTMVTLLMGGYSDAERKEWEGKILPALADHWDEVSDENGLWELRMDALITTAKKSLV